VHGDLRGRRRELGRVWGVACDAAEVEAVSVEDEHEAIVNIGVGVPAVGVLLEDHTFHLDEGREYGVPC
jgi:hypothetical protein